MKKILLSLIVSGLISYMAIAGVAWKHTNQQDEFTGVKKACVLLELVVNSIYAIQL